jgi:hypothetical protein
MRVRGLQFRGLALPAGDQRLDLGGAFCCAESPDAADARGLVWLVRALLQPDRELAGLGTWSPGPDARIACWLASRGEAFVLAVDPAQQRLVLRRRDAASDSYCTQAADPAEIAAFFSERCWPHRLDFERLRTWGVAPAEAWPEPGADEDTLRTEPSLVSSEARPELLRIQVELERARSEAAERAARMERRDVLRAHGQRLAELERELAAARAELEEHSPLAALSEGLDQRMDAFRAAQQTRDSDRQEIQTARRTLLGERALLRAARDRRRAPLAFGLAAFALGSALAALGEWLGLAAAGLGAVLAGTALVQRRRARRRLGRIEAVLAAQRVRERTAEQRFESETEPLRAALSALDLQGIDQLRGALDAYQGLGKRVADLETAHARARGAPADAAAELERLEQELAGPDPAERVRQLEQLAANLVRTRAARPAAPIPVATAEPEELVAAAARGTGLGADELRGRLAAALPLYLSALCAGELTHARHRPSEGWVLRGPARRGARFPDLPPDLAARVGLAFQLALAERTAAERPAPFLIGPDLAALEPDETRSLGRALRRLAGFVQVIRIGPPDPAWAAHADCVARVE